MRKDYEEVSRTNESKSREGFNSTFHGRSLAAKALSMEKLKEYNEALQSHMKAVSIFKKLGDAQIIAEHLYNAAWCPLHLYLNSGHKEEYIEASLNLLNEAIHLEH